MAIKKQDSPVSEYMKIRRYILNIIHRNPGESVRIPTMVELSEQFNVSIPTVNKALKALTKDGYIIGRRGIGSFTNPNIREKISYSLEKEKPLIGIILFDGMTAHFEAYSSRILSKLMEEVTILPGLVYQISLSSRDPDLVLKQLEHEQVDGLLWYSPREKMIPVCKRLAAKNFPIVVMDEEIDNVNSVSFNHPKTVRRCSEMLLEKGHRNIVFYPYTPAQEDQVNALRMVYQNAGIKLDEKLFLKDKCTLQEKLTEIISSGKTIDAIYGPMLLENEVEDFLLSLNPEIFKTCTIVNPGFSLPSQNPFHRISYDYSFSDLAKKAVEVLQAQMNQEENVEIRQEKIDIPLKIE